MAKIFDASEVASHNSPESCWVALYGDVWDVTNFLSKHPGGSRIILKLAGRDATEEYDPIHPPGTLEENLPLSDKLGRINTSTSTCTNGTQNKPEAKTNGEINLQSILNLDEFETLARKQLSRKAWAYYFSASDDQISKEFNNTVYKSIQLRPSVFVDCTRCSLVTNLLGHQVGSPIYVAPAAMARLAHPAGERGIAQGISSFGGIQIISNNASLTPEQIIEGSPQDQIFGWQLYVQTTRKKSEEWLSRINRLSSKIKFIVLTLDAPVPGKRELDEKISFETTSLPSSTDLKGKNSYSPNASEKKSEGGIGRQIFQGTAANLTWRETLPWLAQHTSLPIILKGIQTHEDAYLAAQYFPQVRGIIISNHGGRAADTAAPPVYTLLEIRKYCPEVFNRIEVWIDGGIRRGTDIVKALCLGAKAVGIGRAPLYGLSVGGKEGVERTLEILHAEVDTCMRLLGVERISDLAPRYVNTRAIERDIYDGPSFLQKRGLWTDSKL